MESAAHDLFSRARRCGWYNGRYYRCQSRWSDWGRWVLAGAAILIFLIFLLSLCCLARRRRKRGVTPYYGTGWMAPNGGKFGGNNQNYPMDHGGGYQTGYTNNEPNYNPPPAYGQNPSGYEQNSYNPQNNGYYGNNDGYNSGLQSPPNAYQRDGVYPPPPMPPGGK